MKVLEKDGLQMGIQATKKEITTIQNQIAEVQRALSALLSLEDSFKGKTAESIFSFYKLCHELFLNYMLEFLNEYYKVLGEIQEATQSYEPHARGFIREDFIEQDVTKALKQLQNKTDDLSEEANRIMKRVNDIVSLKELDTKAFEDSVGQAKKKGKNTVEKLNKLDQNQMKALKSPEEKFEIMRNYLSQMRQSMQNPSWEIPNFHFGEAASMPAHNVMYQHVYKEELTRIATKIKEEESWFLKEPKGNWFNRSLTTGAINALGDTLIGLGNTIRDPRGTAKSIGVAVSHPKATFKAIKNDVSTSFSKDVLEGTKETRVRWFTYGAVSLGGEFVGGKGIGSALKARKVGKVAETGARVAEEASESVLKKSVEKSKEVPVVVNRGTVNVLDDGTVWGNIKITQPLYEGTKIPKSFELVAEGKNFWVHPNGTKHMVEYITKGATTHGMPINSQTLLSSFQSSVKNAAKEGIKYEEIMNIGKWELIFSKPRGDGLLPVVKHAVYRP